MSDLKQDDAALMRLIAQADADALTELYGRYNRLVFSMALAVVGDQATAAEITLDVFVRVWQRADTYRPEQARVSTWLIAITRHHAIDVLRRQKSRPETNTVNWNGLLTHNLSGTHDLEEDVTLTLQRQRVRTAVAQLPPEQQQVLWLAYFQGYSHQQIADELKQPLGTVKTRIRLGMQKLRQLLVEEQPSPDQSDRSPTTYFNDRNT